LDEVFGIFQEPFFATPYQSYLADYKVPKQVKFYSELLPRDPGGKVMKEVLKIKILRKEV
jgi:acyl-coenzyme A synthetase/AMP-(fatty) acid ligase